MSTMHVRVLSGGEHYALPVGAVREIAELGAITPVPGAAAAVLGVWNLRGEVMGVVDLATLLGLDRGGGPGRIVVAEQGDLRAGLAVESVVDVAPIPEALEPVDSEYVSAAVLVDRVPVGVVDLGAVLGAVSSRGAR
jgi:purine-binding chemotaxis protein CheW